jgi:hypothetical protein
MLKKVPLPAAVFSVMAVTLAIILPLRLTRSKTSPSLDDAVIPSHLTHEDARAKLLRCSQWRLTDSQTTERCLVTLQARQAHKLEDVVLAEDRKVPSRNRRGIVRVQPVQRPATEVILHMDDTSYRRVVGKVHLAGDPDLVREVAAYLVTDSGP